MSVDLGILGEKNWGYGDWVALPHHPQYFEWKFVWTVGPKCKSRKTEKYKNTKYKKRKTQKSKNIKTQKRQPNKKHKKYNKLANITNIAKIGKIQFLMWPWRNLFNQTFLIYRQ